jgi:cyanophycinase
MTRRTGKLMPIGGGEDKRDNMDVLKTFIRQVNMDDPKIEVITIATSLPDEVAHDYRNAFEDLDIRHYDFIHIEDSRDADDRKFLKRINEADAVFFSGGNQMKLIEVLCKTKFLETLKKRHEREGLLIAGTSAGAAAMSTFMIAGGSSEEALLKGEVKLTNGLGFINDVIIDTHFTERGRYSRLMSIVGTNPKLMGLGFGEDTAAVISNNHIEVIGSRHVVIIDGSSLGYSNITSVKEGDPVTIGGLVVHLLAEGEKFDLRKKMILRKKEAVKRKAPKKKDRKASPSKNVSRRKVKHAK